MTPLSAIPTLWLDSENRILMYDDTFQAFYECSACPCACVCTSGDQLSAWSFGGFFDHNKWDVDSYSIQDLDVYGGSFTFTSPQVAYLYDSNPPIPDAEQLYSVEVRSGTQGGGGAAISANASTGYKSTWVRALTSYYNSGGGFWIGEEEIWSAYYVASSWAAYSFTSSRGASGCCKCGDYVEASVVLSLSAVTVPGSFPLPAKDFPFGTGYPSTITYSITCT